MRYTALFVVLFGTLTAVVTASRGPIPRETLPERAARLHREGIVIDGHNDLPWALRDAGDSALAKFELDKPTPDFMTDIPRLRAGGVGAQFWSVYVPAGLDQTGKAVKTTQEQIDIVHRLIAKYPAVFELAKTADDIGRIKNAGKIASLIGMEGGHSIGGSLDTLRDMYARGARYMTLTHSKNLFWVDSATDAPKLKGLTKFGEEVIREMNRLGMFVDISHVSAAVMRHVLRITTAPVIASHSSAHGVKAHVRNVPDDVLKLVATNGGVIMVNFYPEFIGKGTEAVDSHTDGGRPKHLCDDHKSDVLKWTKDGERSTADVGTVADHIDHIVKVAGIDSVGLGSDFDGIPSVPKGLEDVSKFPALTEELLRRGYSDEAVKKVLGGNLLRAMRAMERVAISASTPASTSL